MAHRRWPRGPPKVAAWFSLSPRTVDRHLNAIFTKLGVATRTAAPAFAIERGLR